LKKWSNTTQLVEEDIGIGMKKKMKAGGSDFDADDYY
jgi:hypothetical protein